MSYNEWMEKSGFCKRLKQARLKKRLCQEEVVKRVEGRCTVGILDAYEIGSICPSVGRVVDLARIYGCSVDWLCGLPVAPGGGAEK